MTYATIKTDDGLYCSNCTQDVKSKTATACLRCGAKFISAPADFINNFPVKYGDTLYYMGGDEPIIVTGILLSDTGIKIRWESENPIYNEVPKTDGFIPIEEIGYSVFLNKEDVPECRYTVISEKLLIHTQGVCITSKEEYEEISEDNGDTIIPEDFDEEEFDTLENAKLFYEERKALLESKYIGKTDSNYIYLLETIKLEKVVACYPGLSEIAKVEVADLINYDLDFVAAPNCNR